MAGDFTVDSPLPLATVLHMITIKLSSTNYLIWKNQMMPLLAYQKLTGYVDGSIPMSPSTITSGESTSQNPAYSSWIAADQRALILIQSSLSEEAMAKTLGNSTSHSLWSALQTVYCHDSVEPICDQLTAIGHPLDETDKSHWFLCGLGSSFETFSTTQRLIRPRPLFRDLVLQAESHETFLQSVTGPTAAPVAFVATSTHGSSSHNANRGRGGRTQYRGGSNRGRSRGNRRPPHCQLCRTDGHYAPQCLDLHTFANRPPTIDANLAQAFQAQCNVSTSSPD
nr:hypothetical protein [Tanacetum cinerariifolium]